MRILFLLLFLISSNAYAISTDTRISDNDGDVLDITSAGLLQINTVNTSGTPTTGASDTIRISDNDGDIIAILSTGELTATWT